ncbi:SseB family protein [Nonomuraea wenchangensis]|uniref:SseB protein N-terminal domain-containing protein n=1 Tax=Nonomuraea wenchangensis TaxID=568860 RepID=A0A1I0IU98_9ACTN|nr:SseB family protein [Nonomuraea wenchangensis]SEU00777.1 SseB protein N-terminal domain-containing protein [Nonomuraea wenchangensis]
MPSIPRPLDPADDGGAPPAVAAALAAHRDGTGDVAAVLNALAGARLLVPVVALLTRSEVGEHGLRQEKESEMALPKLVGQDGRHAVPAFTGTDALTRWRPDARPIQSTTLQVCRAAAQEGAAAVVIDVAGPVPFVIEGAVLEALAAVESGTAAQLDRATVATVARVEPARKRRWFSRR